MIGKKYFNKYLKNICITAILVLVGSNFSIARELISRKLLFQIEKSRVIKAANLNLNEKPVTITSAYSSRSAGGRHDFFSEGDYWWPDPSNPNGPYIRKDGETNPENFVEHRRALIRFSKIVPTLIAAFKLTHQSKYSVKAIEHLKAWFVNEETRMNPNLQYAQAIKGVTTGRGVGIIDAIHFVEIVQSIIVLEKYKQISRSDLKEIKNWFNDFLNWMNTSKNGIEERDAKNNHGTCWVMQAAEYARFVSDEKMIQFCKEKYKKELLPNQMALDGSFPLETARTKPYSYSLFNLDVMTIVCRILTDEKENLMNYSLPDGRSIKTAMEFMFPFVADKSKWKFNADVMYYDLFPNRQPFLLFGALYFNKSQYFELWKKLEPDPTNEEVIRNFPIRQPVLWID